MNEEHDPNEESDLSDAHDPHANSKQRTKAKEQDLIETVVPPRQRPNSVVIEEAMSPDETPTERPPITEPAESGARSVDGAQELPPAKKA